MPLGIPDRSTYGALGKLRAGQLLDWIVQKHDARRAGQHYDVRLGSPELGLYSWAVRKGVGGPGVKRLAVQQPLHEHEYGEFQGRIPSGYGAGTVRRQDKGQVLITKVLPDRINFTLAHKKYPERFTLLKPQKGREKDWLLVNVTPTGTLPYGKAKFTSIPSDKVEDVLGNLQPGASVQAKIDGSSTLTELLKDKLELVSYRQSKVTGGPIVHTERAFHGIPNVTLPKPLIGSVLRTETYGVRDGEAIPSQELGGILNSALGKSLKDQEDRGIQLRHLVWDIVQKGKKPVTTEVPYAQRMADIRQILAALTGPDARKTRSVLETPEEAKTPEDALKLWHNIQAGKHPLTTEGVVIHPETGKPIKSKFLDEHDVYIRGVLPGKKKWEGRGAGAFVYSHKPKGPIVGEVGTGFSDQLRLDMFSNPKDFIGRLAKVRASTRLPSGALFQPSLLSLHEDYPQAPVRK